MAKENFPKSLENAQIAAEAEKEFRDIAVESDSKREKDLYNKKAARLGTQVLEKLEDSEEVLTEKGELYDVPIPLDDLSGRTQNILLDQEVMTLGKLSELKESDIAKWKNAGLVVLEELGVLLRKNGLKFGMKYKDTEGQEEQELPETYYEEINLKDFSGDIKRFLYEQSAGTRITWGFIARRFGWTQIVEDRYGSEHIYRKLQRELYKRGLWPIPESIKRKSPPL